MAYVNFPNQFLDEIRARLSVSEIIGRKVKLQRKGKEYQGLCPFHNEKTPSFTVNDQKGFYHCFGCGAHGDVIRFLTDGEGVPFPEAIEQLARKAGLEMPKISPEQVQRQKQEATLADVVFLASEWFESNLNQQPPRHLTEYIKKRGLDASIQQQFHLGYSQDSFTALQQYLKSKDISLSLMKAAGLVAVGNSGDPYDKFRNRLMFPIADARGRIVAFGGRILGEGNPKYLNSPETSLFRKGELLYNYHHARGKAFEKGRIVVAEGYMDVIALHRAGIEESVAPLGTAITESQLHLLWKCADEPILCLDGDAAGQRAMERAAHLALPLLSAGKSLRFAILPSGMDPDDILTNEGSNALEALISKARPLSDVLWSIEQQREPVTTPEQKAALEQRLEKLVASITHVAVQNHYRMFFREKIWKFTRNKTKRSAEPTRQHAIHITDVHLEEDILAVLLTFPALLQDESLYESLYAVEFSSKILDKIRLIALEEGVSEEGLASGLVALLKREGLQSEVARLKLVKDNALSGIINSVFAITLQDAKRRIERNIAELHLLHLKEEQQEIRQQYTEESETRAMAFQEEIERWLLHIQQLELQESDEMNM